jgi:hypothetical protein
MKKKYSWTRNYGVPAQIAGEIIDSLPSKSPDELLRSARELDSPLHNCFEWNNTNAARAYRRIQAGTMINSLHVEIYGSDEKPRVVKAFIRSVDRVSYIDVQAASDKELTREERRCYRAMKSFEERYNALQLAHGVIAEIHLVRQTVARRSRKKARAA